MPSDSWVERLGTVPTNEPFTTATARDARLHPQALHWLTANGFLRRLAQSVYVVASVPDSLELRCEALRLVVPEDTFVCDRTAAWLHAGDRALAPNEHLSIPPLSAFRPSEHGRLRNDLTASGEREILPRDLMVIHGLSVTTPLRTALDLGRLERNPDLRLHGMDCMLSLGSFSHDELLAEVPRFNRRRGVVMLRALAPLADGGSESFAESALRRRWHNAGLPRPETQIPVLVDGREVFRIDMGLEGLDFGAEYDGEEHHGEDQAEHDESRRKWLDQARGWWIEVFRRKDVFGQHQDAEHRLVQGYEAARARKGLPRRFFTVARG